MAIIHYLLVARKNSKVLCDYTGESGNVPQISIKILKLVKPNHKTAITYDDRYCFYYINDSNITVMCMCDKAYPIESAFELLKDVMLIFLEKFSNEQIENAYSYSLNKEFQPIIRQKLNYYNKNLDLKRNATLNKLKENLLETKNVLIETTETLNERGERINLIMKKAETLKGDSKVYFDNAKKIKNKEKGYDCKFLYTALFVICFCYVLASILCGGVTLPNCFTE